MPKTARKSLPGKARQSDESNDYTEGSIVKIKLQNIYTYDSVEFTCGPHLNVIIGPNGTGKSTICCAICLGLAGKLNLLGRAQQAAEFIKHGQEKGRIEIELFNSSGDNHRICREISRDNASKWKVQGQSCSQKTVEELVKRLNIQIGNLTQFLPQDRVAEFAKLNSSELLESTEKAVGDTELFKRHQTLTSSQTKAKTLALNCNNLKEQLEQEIQKNSRIEQDVRNLQERENYLEKIRILNMKKTWLVFESQRQTYMILKEEKEGLEKQLKSLRAAHAPLQRKIDCANKEKEAVAAKKKTNASELKEVAKKCQSITQQVDSFTDQIIEIQDELKLRQDQEQARQKKLRDLKKQLDALQNDLKNAADTEDIQPQIDQVNKAMREASHSLTQINHKGEEVKIQVDGHRKQVAGLQRELQGLRNVENRRLETLRKKHKDTYEAVTWLRQNKDMFNGVIHEPPMISVNMKNPQHAKYVENHISFNDMRAFICESSDDLNLFMNKVREDQNLKVNAVRTPPNFTQKNCRPNVPINNYRPYGFHSYLKDLFTCPEAVMFYLCAQYKVHSIPIGDNKTQNMVDTIKNQHPELNYFYTANCQYVIKKSRYDGSIASKRMGLKDPSLLTDSMDVNRERELQGQLEALNRELKSMEEEYGQLQKKSQEVDRKLNKLRDERKNLTTKREMKTRLRAQIESKKKAIIDSESEAVDLSLEEKKAEKKMDEINNKKFRNLKNYLENTRKCVESSKEKVRLSVRLEDACRYYSRLEGEIREQSQTLQQAEVALERSKETVNENKLLAKRLLAEAKKSTNTGPNEELSMMTKKLFEPLPSTLEEVEAKIHEHQVRADCVAQTDKSVEQEYNKRCRVINKLTEDLKLREDEQTSHQDEVNNAKTLWLEPLQLLISRINKSFSYFFSCLRCVGEVDLFIPENPEEYNKYGIRIKVKFRDSEPLQELSVHHQSGGERSVTTVLYMMALQDLTRCPFRCVDEINQGMDPVNERKVFELVVQTVCRKNTSQYFLLTPKLLPDLEYADNMTVLCVSNGPYMMNHTEWRLSSFIRTRKNMEE